MTLGGCAFWEVALFTSGWRFFDRRRLNLLQAGDGVSVGHFIRFCLFSNSQNVELIKIYSRDTPAFAESDFTFRGARIISSLIHVPFEGASYLTILTENSTCH